MGGWCDMLDLFLYFWLRNCFCHRWRQDPGLDWILFCFSVAILLSVLFLSVMEHMDIWSLLSAAQGQVIPFYSCKAVSLFLFQHIRKGKPFLTHPLLPQLLLWVGEANHSSLWKKSSGNSLNWNFAFFPWQQITRVQPNPTLTILGFWFFMREKGFFKCCIRTTPRCESDSFGYVYKNGNDKKDKDITVFIFSHF